MSGRPTVWTAFGRAQLASLIATAVDYVAFIGTVELLGVWYVPARTLGATLGAIINFWINREWSFLATDGHWKPQAYRYALISLGSLALNTGGTLLLTEQVGIPYAASGVLTSLLVGWFYNFPLHRRFVFR